MAVTHNVAIWNAKVGRGRGPRVARHIAAYSQRHSIDVWLLQEVDGFRRDLAGVPGFKVWQPRGRPLAGNCAILVRADLATEDPAAQFMETTWPRPKAAGIHPARVDALWTVEGVRYGSIHIVSRKGRPEGRRQRWAAGREHGQRLAELAQATAPPLVLGGDMNEHSGERAPFFPGWVADQAELKVNRTGRIEWAMGKGVTFGRPVTDHDNAGSDHPIIRTTVTAAVDIEEPPVPWRVAESLETLLAEVNAAAPNRSKASDGSIGDAAHASRDSDHNPWVIKDGMGIVRARDFTHDPAGGLDCTPLADALATLLDAGTHPALRSGAYVIWQRRILSRDRLGEGWRPYAGSNPHDKHLHLSVTTDPSAFDSSQPWGVMEEEVTEQDKLDIAKLVVKELLAAQVDPLDGDKPTPLLQIWRQTHNRAGKALRA